MSDDLVKPCPFCGSTNIKSGGDDKVIGYWCLDCQAVGPNQYGRYEWNDRADRIEELEAKLAKAEGLLVDAMVQLENGKIKTRRNRAYLIGRFLAELKRETDE